MARRPEYVAAASGRVELFFTPDPQKSFKRGFTGYFFDGRSEQHLGSPDTPKSQGVPVGRVTGVRGAALKVENARMLHNGDGLCFLNRSGTFEVFRVNRVESVRVYQRAKHSLTPGP